MRRLIQAFFAIALAVMLVACGGTSNRDKQAADAAANSSTGTTTSAAAAVEVLTSSNTISSAGAEAVITAFIKTAANVALEGQTVAFSASSGTLQIVSSTSDASGAVSAKLTAGSDKALRNITVTVTAASASGNVVVGVTDSGLSIAGSASLQAGAAANTYTVRALDSAGVGIPGVVLAASSTLGNAFSPASATTNSTGTASFSYTPTNAGTDTIRVTGLGTQATTNVLVSATSISITAPVSNALIAVGAPGQTFTVHVSGSAGQAVAFSTTRGAVAPNAAVLDGSGNASTTITSSTAGPATIVAQITGIGQVSLPVVFTAITPSSVAVQANPSAVQPNANGSTSNQSAVQAVVRDASGNAVAGTTVTFTLQSDTSGGSLSQASATTDNNGRAQVQFIPGPSATANNGVLIRATAGSVSGNVALTVSGQALFITIAYSNTIADLDDTTYTKTFSVYVTDANGIAVQNQSLTLSALPETYFKGSMSYSGTLWEPPSPPSASCPNEDLNRNGILDADEDSVLLGNGNGNHTLEPGNVAVVTPGTVTTDNSGRTTFTIQYGKRFATWVKVEVMARGTVAGTESSQSVLLTLPIALADVGDETVAPVGEISPFGIANDCTNKY